ncbi:hypothetical protein AVEN_122921-1 [Araneus ventricosus]|uniref:Uncharacterized protein n=1 Tax=Araneus ventricosus TaxID=182803 RepID=A0A4Y2KNH1_ARAVE|nr:hypothetical protein AVEN_122921-1 [Araneus ventricosus]
MSHFLLPPPSPLSQTVTISRTHSKRDIICGRPLLHSIHLSQHWFFSTHSSRKIRHVIHLKLQSALAVGESDLLSPSTAALRFPPFPTKVASSQGPNLVKSVDVPTALAKGTYRIGARRDGIWFGWIHPLCYSP